MAHEYHPALRVKDAEHESDSRARSMIKDEEPAEMRSSMLGLEMTLNQHTGGIQQQNEGGRSAMTTLRSAGGSSAGFALLQELQRGAESRR